MTVSAVSEELLEGMTCGISISRRDQAKIRIRAHPWAEVRCERTALLEQLQAELLSLSIGSTLLHNCIRIQGISNCSLITPFVPMKYSWWKDAVSLFVEGKHRDKEGLLEIMALRPNARVPRNLDFLK